ncbi:hypothetical protein Cgig2_026560 [Carnegiea gigantea]|uniref:Uncharacterized protein n=1 Tax=Carnegiea gigantea TaxID=171969 RepID=A0A9Q1Q5I2_9CARY|nr:hypothetical protein Cgig2_026560 [Carnegiea gigantea]
MVDVLKSLMSTMADAITHQVSEQVERAVEAASSARPPPALEYPLVYEGERFYRSEGIPSPRPTERGLKFQPKNPRITATIRVRTEPLHLLLPRHGCYSFVLSRPLIIDIQCIVPAQNFENHGHDQSQNRAFSSSSSAPWLLLLCSLSSFNYRHSMHRLQV